MLNASSASTNKISKLERSSAKCYVVRCQHIEIQKQAIVRRNEALVRVIKTMGLGTRQPTQPLATPDPADSSPCRLQILPTPDPANSRPCRL